MYISLGHSGSLLTLRLLLHTYINLTFFAKMFRECQLRKNYSLLFVYLQINSFLQQKHKDVTDKLAAYKKEEGRRERKL